MPLSTSEQNYSFQLRVKISDRNPFSSTDQKQLSGQPIQIQMKGLVTSRLISIYTVCSYVLFLFLFFFFLLLFFFVVVVFVFLFFLFFLFFFLFCFFLFFFFFVLFLLNPYWHSCTCPN